MFRNLWYHKLRLCNHCYKLFFVVFSCGFTYIIISPKFMTFHDNVWTRYTLYTLVHFEHDSLFYLVHHLTYKLWASCRCIIDNGQVRAAFLDLARHQCSPGEIYCMFAMYSIQGLPRWLSRVRCISEVKWSEVKWSEVKSIQIVARQVNRHL